MVVAVVCIGLELTYEKHPHVRFEYWFNFYGFFAIAATLALALLATLARNFLVDKEEATHG